MILDDFIQFQEPPRLLMIVRSIITGLIWSGRATDAELQVLREAQKLLEGEILNFDEGGLHG